MTAAHIAKVLGQTKITINHRFMEWMGHHYYEENPMASIEMKIKEREHIVAEFLDGIEFVDTGDYLHEITASYPENGN